MKKFLVMLLAFAMVLCFAACGDSSETSSTNATSSAATSSEATSSEAVSSEAASSEEESSKVESSVAESSEEVSSNLTEDGEEIAEPISQYINWSTTIGKGAVNAKATDAAAVQLTHLNVGAIDGVAMIIGFNADYEEADIYSADGSYDKYEVFVFEYNHDVWGYTLAASYGLDAEDKGSISIPEDGYVIAIHSYYADKIEAVKAIAEGTVVTPYGFRGTNALDAEIIYGTATIDGNVSVDEYGDAVWLVEPDNEAVSYEQFDNKGFADDYYSTAEVYMMYDENNLYFAVVVNSPYHFCNLTQSNAGSMWSQECIQVNVTTIAPNDEYYTATDYWDWNNAASQSSANTTALNLMRQYGFSVNTETGEMLNALWQGDSSKNSPEFNVTRTEDQLTIYEVAIPWSELGNDDNPFTPEAGAEIGLSISFNSGRSADDFMNYYLRDGGGVIGRNDWTKIPVITLGE